MKGCVIHGTLFKQGQSTRVSSKGLPFERRSASGQSAAKCNPPPSFLLLHSPSWRHDHRPHRAPSGTPYLYKIMRRFVAHVISRAYCSCFSASCYRLSKRPESGSSQAPSAALDSPAAIECNDWSYGGHDACGDSQIVLMTTGYASHMRATEENCSASRRWLRTLHATAQRPTDQQSMLWRHLSQRTELGFGMLASAPHAVDRSQCYRPASGPPCDC